MRLICRQPNVGIWYSSEFKAPLLEGPKIDDLAGVYQNLSGLVDFGSQGLTVVKKKARNVLQIFEKFFEGFLEAAHVHIALHILLVLLDESSDVLVQIEEDGVADLPQREEFDDSDPIPLAGQIDLIITPIDLKTIRFDLYR